jgi:hypothetical protein
MQLGIQKTLRGYILILSSLQLHFQNFFIFNKQILFQIDTRKSVKKLF